MKRILSSILFVLTLVLCGCAPSQNTPGSGETAATVAQASFAHRYATASEAKDLLFSNREYYAGFSQNDLDYRMQKTGATMEEYQAFAAKQTLDFTDDEKAMLDKRLAEMAKSVAERGYTLPPLDEIVFVKTTMAEERSAGGYTHGTTVFLAASILEYLAQHTKDGDPATLVTEFLWHEIFHCLTRNNPDFRANMYQLIHFTIRDTDFVLPPSVREYHISNPDVEHHDASAIFRIDGKDVECFTDFITTQHFQKKGDEFFDYATTALVPVDGTDVFYKPEQVSNFDEVFGANTKYVVDPEECMADNFAFALTWGTAGRDGNGYNSPHIIEGILAYLSQ